MRTVSHSLKMLVVATAMLAGCGGGGGGSPAVTITGTVSAPSGSIAFNGPTLTDRLLALRIGGPANAAISGTSPVAGVSVTLIQIDANGAQVGSAVATATTDASGNYSLRAPAGFTPAVNFVVRASGSTATLDAIITGATVNVDPSTEAVKALVLTQAGGNTTTLAAMSVGSVAEFATAVAGLVNDVDLSAALTATAMATAIKTAIQNDAEVLDQVTSLAQSGVVTGRITDAKGAGLANIVIRALDYNNWVLRAATLTDANGNYALHVPPSPVQGYALGAMNFTTATFAASEWLKSGGHGITPYQADRVTVAAGTPATVNMQLADGARVTGTVTPNAATTPLPGIRVMARELTIGAPMASMRTRADGSFTLNGPINTSFVLIADNFTLQAFATAAYNGPAGGGSTTGGGATGFNRGTVLKAPSAGLAIAANFGLVTGQKVAGIVTVGPTALATPVPGAPVRFFDGTGAFVTGESSDLAGLYRIWLQPNPSPATAYVVRSRGQALSADLSAGTPVTDNFVAAVNSKSATLVDGASNPVGQVVVKVFDATTAATNAGAAFEGFEVSNGDGSITVFTTSANNTNKKLTATVNTSGIGSGVYSGALSLGAGTNVRFDGTSLGNVTLPTGATLSGTVTVTTNGLPPAGGNYNIQVFNGGTAAGNFFVNSQNRGDGSYAINLPGGTYSVRSCQLGTTTCSAFQSVMIAPPTPNTANFTM